MGLQRFFFNFGTLGAAVLLIVASVAFGPRAATWVGLGIGIAGCVMSFWFLAVLVHHRRLQGHPELHAFGRTLGVWSALTGGMATVAVWEIIDASVFSPDVSRWLTLANGLVIAVLAFAGLVINEIRTERVVHVLQVVERGEREAR